MARPDEDAATPGQGWPATGPAGRFLGNVDTLELHDRYRERPACRLVEIPVNHCRWYDTMSQALADRSYGNCYWCLGGALR